MLKIFGRKSDQDKRNTEKDLLTVDAPDQVDCLCDFTFNFHWQHKGEKLDPSWKIPHNQLTFGDLVEHLKGGGDVRINGNAGHRLSSSMGVDLKYFGGNGKDIPVGDVYVEGDADTRMGISMARGNIYIKGKVKEPLGNLVEVKTDVKDYRKFRSITDIMHHGLEGDKLESCQLIGNKLLIDDGTVKDTVGARLDQDAEIIMNGNTDLSTGILMRKGKVLINGSAGKNTGALLNGGTVIINGNTDDFSAIDMIKGAIIINGDAGKFLAANKKNGMILAKKGRALPPAEEKSLTNQDRNLLLDYGLNPQGFRKFE
jgi:formylmethanofuran dehydrogenase subunit C